MKYFCKLIYDELHKATQRFWTYNINFIVHQFLLISGLHSQERPLNRKKYVLEDLPSIDDRWHKDGGSSALCPQLEGGLNAHTFFGINTSEIFYDLSVEFLHTYLSVSVISAVFEVIASSKWSSLFILLFLAMEEGRTHKQLHLSHSIPNDAPFVDLNLTKSCRFLETCSSSVMALAGSDLHTTTNCQH